MFEFLKMFRTNLPMEKVLNYDAIVSYSDTYIANGSLPL